MRVFQKLTTKWLPTLYVCNYVETTQQWETLMAALANAPIIYDYIDQ